MCNCGCDCCEEVEELRQIVATLDREFRGAIDSLFGNQTGINNRIDKLREEGIAAEAEAERGPVVEDMIPIRRVWHMYDRGLLGQIQHESDRRAAMLFVDMIRNGDRGGHSNIVYTSEDARRFLAREDPTFTSTSSAMMVKRAFRNAADLSTWNGKPLVEKEKRNGRNVLVAKVDRIAAYLARQGWDDDTIDDADRERIYKWSSYDKHELNEMHELELGGADPDDGRRRDRREESNRENAERSSEADEIREEVAEEWDQLEGATRAEGDATGGDSAHDGVSAD